jgi:hypothetical protein
VASQRKSRKLFFFRFGSRLNFFQICLELASFDLSLGVHPSLIDSYFSLYYPCLNLEYQVELLV